MRRRLAAVLVAFVAGTGLIACDDTSCAQAARPQPPAPRPPAVRAPAPPRPPAPRQPQPPPAVPVGGHDDDCEDR